MGLNGHRTALISGANRGIGAAVAKRLFDAGWAVSLGMRVPEMPGWADTAPERVHLFAYEATQADAGTAWAAEVTDRFGRIDAVVANAGIMVPQTIVDVTDDEMTQLLEINVQAPRRLAAACWDALGAAGKGRVILLGSLSGKRVKSAKSGSYSVSKFAVIGMAHALRHAGFDKGIRATAVCPGFVATDMAMAITDRAADAMTQPDDLARVIEMLIDLPNEASVAEFCVNCQLEESF
ncbi:SDR family NAD(P)-dependent oxidoreductase [Pseudosulfitobacter pseudonitzschiae]|uniref:SDR family NAD(P)-dependent oxidoreductase n=1 Tax=Pseudosulfitobacter pseudonitzschiae TaxID=1402135 RepID=UPI001AF16E65|nr:SDR family NAD(P)-dependent oxidoreductase [Pseudosulfitobacter pseudonitzschiae]MBM1816012.1 SDR family NAD(P)-dependent oxidoreductase [Pseudosulfitobacter pseudonitzschiae]MBM1833318.1 SDR family NAD(P)-dependent oxidoreductase [Pseudosulfitobacter pseudonitzschiae]MBM1838185.1 SDR family NAD(P)-dependent oxidoreductase [Pseudosulfitobacter pseudonitzschiae]MBM1842717.1 SDR family NAD(P)-dependent oxidoreductase [Pseudosulfitobacter pseudonitzschiae]MBM1847583.1 SDR family NAD(P)-depende